MEYKNPGKITFKTKILNADGKSAYIEFPQNVEEFLV